MGEFIDMGTDNEVILTMSAHYSSITLSSSRAHRESPEIRTFFSRACEILRQKTARFILRNFGLLNGSSPKV